MEPLEPLPAPQLVAAAREALGAGTGRRRRRLPASRALQLAGEVLAVAAGLKPALLARRRLEAALRCRPGPFVDVAAARGGPALCGPAQAQAIRGHLAALLAHLEAAEEATAGPVSCSEVVPAGWNLCTVFGVLLGYPAAYHFPAEEGGENCLALTPLRVFTVWARCPRIQGGLAVQIYSFSIPESLREELREVLDAWCDDLRDNFRAQSDFVDLCISSEVVSLPAVAL
uniref:Chromosome 1 open reading frame 74 n=1 Tax=Anser cygnoides TaxID=8845 RepID=A0A8B9D3W1_ANSCY